jgi:hypothetical protein
LLALVVIALLAACGGGGGGGASIPAGGGAGLATPAAAVTLGANQGLVQFSIAIPAAGTAATQRRPQYVDPGTKSMTLTLIEQNGAAVSPAPGTVQGPFNFVAGAPGCSTGTPLVCSFAIAAPAGNDVFLATTFSAPNATGPLGSGTVALTVVQNATNQATLTLDGPIQTIDASSSNSANSDTLWNGVGTFVPITAAQAGVARAQSTLGAARPLAAATAAPTAIPSERLFITAKDAANGSIVSPTAYNQPIVLTLSLHGGPANAMLADTPPAGFGCSAASTSVDGGTVAVCTPADVITLSIIPTVPSPTIYVWGWLCIQANFPSVTASLGSPPAGFAPLYFPFTIEVGS